MTKLLFGLDGQVRTIHSDESQELMQAIGSIHIQRASHVEPTLQGEWVADCSPSGGPILGPFRTRTEALSAEVAWLDEADLGMEE